MNTKPKVVFFGSGPVAAESLRLLSKHAEIEVVITKSRAEHYRGSAPVIEVADNIEVPFIEVKSKHELDEALKSSTIKSRLGVLIDFGIIVSKSAIEYFPLGIINSHFSLLPEWRGADPITFAVLSGQEITGVSLMLLVEKMDEGPILLQENYELNPQITTPILTDELIKLSDAMLKNTLTKYINGLIAVEPQSSEVNATYSRKLTKDDGTINFKKPAAQIEREIRAYQGWPGSKLNINGIELTVTKAHLEHNKLTPGIFQVTKTSLIFGCTKDSIAIDRVKPAGKNEMPIESFLAGYKSRLQ